MVDWFAMLCHKAIIFGTPRFMLHGRINVLAKADSTVAMGTAVPSACSQLLTSCGLQYFARSSCGPGPCACLQACMGTCWGLFYGLIVEDAGPFGLAVILTKAHMSLGQISFQEIYLQIT